MAALFPLDLPAWMSAAILVVAVLALVSTAVAFFGRVRKSDAPDKPPPDDSSTNIKDFYW